MGGSKLLRPGAMQDAAIHNRQAENRLAHERTVEIAGAAIAQIGGLKPMAQSRATRETLLLAAAVAWCTVLAGSLLYIILIVAL